MAIVNTKMLFVALLVFVPSFTAALSATGVDPNNDEIDLPKDRILGENRITFTYGNSTYEVFLFEADDWSFARSYCKQLGMELVSIETEEENAAITAALDELAVGNYFTSLSDKFKEDDYYWESTGQPLGSYSNWYDKNPELGVADCSLIAAGDINSPVNGKWQSIGCKFAYPFICEGSIV